MAEPRVDRRDDRPAPPRTPRAIVMIAVLGALIGAVVAPVAAAPLGQFAVILDRTNPAMDPVAGPTAALTGADGLLWFANSTYAQRPATLNRRNGDGSVTTFVIPSSIAPDAQVRALASGSDGNLWLAIEVGAYGPSLVAKATPTGAMTLVANFDGELFDLVAGPDGNLWYTRLVQPLGAGAVLGRLTTDGAITEFASPHPAALPLHLTVGPDDAIWFTDTGSGATSFTGSVMRATTSGSISVVAEAGVTPGWPAGSYPRALATGPDRNVWVGTQSVSDQAAMLRVSPAGSVTAFTTSGLGWVQDIISVCGDLYLAQLDFVGRSVPVIWRLTPTGAFSAFSDGLPEGTSPEWLAAQANGDLWIAAGGTTGGRIMGMGTGCDVIPPSTTTTSTTSTAPDGSADPVAPAATPVRSMPSFTG